MGYHVQQKDVKMVMGENKLTMAEYFEHSDFDDTKYEEIAIVAYEKVGGMPSFITGLTQDKNYNWFLCRAFFSAIAMMMGEADKLLIARTAHHANNLCEMCRKFLLKMVQQEEEKKRDSKYTEEV